MREWYRALIRLRRGSEALNDGDLAHTKVRWSEQERWLAMDRGGVRVLANLGQQEAGFEAPDGFRVALVSRERSCFLRIRSRCCRTSRSSGFARGARGFRVA